MRDAIAAAGVEGLVVDELTQNDLDRIGWSGNPGHIRNVAEKLGRAAGGEIEYLVVRAPDGSPVCKGMIDFASHDDAGAIEQLATHEDVRGLGLASRLIAEAERRIAERGKTWAIIGVEDDNPLARKLYERLGYVAYDRQPDSWEAEDPDGKTYLYETEITLMRKRPEA